MNNREKIKQLIEESKYILDFDEGWGEGRELPISKSAWLKVLEILENFWNYWDVNFPTEKIMPLPIIGPCADGSIDIFWNLGNKNQILVNIVDYDTPPTYYGVIKNKFSISHTIKGIVVEPIRKTFDLFSVILSD